MDWTQTLVIIGIFSAFFIYLLNRIEGLGNKINSVENKVTTLESEVRNTNQRIDSTNQRITDLRTDVNQRLSTIEGYLVPRKVVRFEESEHKQQPKEN